MRRTAMEKLVAWKSSDERKPMVLKGARQVGSLEETTIRVLYISTLMKKMS